MKGILKKIFTSLLVLLGVISVVFLMFQAFGDPARLIAGQTGDKQTIDNIRKDLNLDKPRWKQYLLYLNDLSPVSVYTSQQIERKKIHGFFFGSSTRLVIKTPYLGRSYQTKKNVTDILITALPGTLVLAFTAMLFACFFGILLGVIAAVKKNTWIDYTAVLSSIAGISAPSFFMAIIVLYFFAVVLQPYTGLPITGSLFEIDEVTGEKYIQLKNLILPAFTLGIRPMAIITQLTRSSMLDVLSQDYIRTAYAKGLSQKQVLFRHALPNAMNPVISAVTGWFAELLAGSFFIEYIFGWKGIGKITVDALEKLDYPVVTGSLIFSACIFILINLLSDYLHRKTDPRITA